MRRGMRKNLYMLGGVMLTVCAATLMPLPSHAAPVRIEPLFQYPSAPDSIDNLSDKSDWLMRSFWNDFDFSASKAVDQNALNDAFAVYSSAMRFANRDVVMNSVDNLIKKVKGNPTMTLQMAKAAEEALYGPRAEIWSDEVYLPFIKCVTSDKSLSGARTARYADQLKKLTTSAVGKKAPGFRYRLRNRHERDFKPTAKYTLIEFGNPDCDDCRYAKTHLEMASDIMEMVEAGTLQILFIVPDVAPDEEEEVLSMLAGYPEKWVAGIGYGIDDMYDIRLSPSFYLLGKKGDIIVKNANVANVIEAIRNEISRP